MLMVGHHDDSDVGRLFLGGGQLHFLAIRFLTNLIFNPCSVSF